jgi:hypothetical protein
MTFSIGNQTGGVINNVAGDQHISGGQQGVLVTTDDVRRTLATLRQAVAAASPDRVTKASAQAEIGQMDQAIRGERPDRHRFARALERLTRLLAAAGSLATAGAALTSPLHALASWLGTIGEPVLPLLAGLG